MRFMVVSCYIPYLANQASEFTHCKSKLLSYLQLINFTVFFLDSFLKRLLVGSKVKVMCNHTSLVCFDLGNEMHDVAAFQRSAGSSETLTCTFVF